MTFRHLSAYAVLAVLGPAYVVACAADPGDAPKGLGGASSTVGVSVHTTTSSSANTGTYGGGATSSNTGVHTSVGNTGVGSTSGSVGTTASSSSSTSSTTPPCTTCALTLTYDAGQKGMTQTIGFNLELTNTGTGSQDLSQVTIRYYFTADGASGMVGTTDSAQLKTSGPPYSVGIASSVMLTVNPMTTPTTTADTYIELSFATTAGQLPQGGMLDLTERAYTPNYSVTFNQANDYSYNGTPAALAATTTITVYVAGTLVYGTEPM